MKNTIFYQKIQRKIPYDFYMRSILSCLRFPYDFFHAYDFRTILFRVRFWYDFLLRTILRRVRFSSVRVRCEYDSVSR